MKKVLYGLAMVTAVATTSCGNTTKPLIVENDSTEITEPEKLVSEDAVFFQVSKIYERLNQMGESEVIDLAQLEQEFCTSYFLNLKQRIARFDENPTGDMCFMGDEGYHWLVGQSLPLTIESLRTQILSDTEALAQIKFASADEDDPCGMTLKLQLEDGEWKVSNWLDPEVYDEGGYVAMMENYIMENNIGSEKQN